MPVVSVKLWDLERLAKHKLSDVDIVKLLAVFKAEVEEIKDDEVTYEAAHDRADTFSAEGLGRAIGIYLGTRDVPEFKVRDGKVKLDISNAPKYRPYAFGAVVRGLDLDDEAIRQLFQLQEKLAISYGKRREIVSIGLYDLDKLDPNWDNGITIEYKEVEGGSMVPLGETEEMTFEEVLERTEKGKEYGHLVVRGHYPVFECCGKVMSLAPILNAEDFKITENTKNVFVDVTGTVPEVMLRVLDVMVTSLTERGEEAEIERVEVLGYGKTPRMLTKKIKLDKEYMKRLAGVELEWERELRKMGIKVVNDVAIVPPYRVDVFGVVDLVEDALSAHGYERLKVESLPPTHWGSADTFADYVARVMVGMGLDEVFNFVLVDKELVEKLLKVEPVFIKNPRMKSYSAARPSLIPSLLLAVKKNQEHSNKVEIFEIGPVVLPHKTVWRLGVAISKDKATITDVGAVLMGLKELFGLKLKLEKLDADPFVSGRAASIVMRNKVVGVLGEIHPKYLVELGIKRPVAVLEIDLNALRT